MDDPVRAHAPAGRRASPEHTPPSPADDRSFRLLTSWRPSVGVLLGLGACGAVAGVLIGWLLAPAPAAWPTAVLAAFAPLLIAIDFAEHRLPDVLTLPCAVLSGCALLIGALLSGDWGSLGSGLLGALGLTAALFVLFLLGGGAFGFGDVKLGISMGMCLGAVGVTAVVLGPLLGLVLGGVVGVILILLGRANRKSAIALGPYLLIGTLAVLVLLGSGG